jgi:hypothetical protein
MRSSILLVGTAKTYPSGCPHWKKFITIRSDERGGHAIGPPHAIHLQGYVLFNHCRLSFP